MVATCVDAGAYRVDCHVVAPVWEGSIPEPGGEVLVSVHLLALQGTFGLTSHVESDVDHSLLEAEEGSLVWEAPWLAPALVAQFEWTQAPGRLEIVYDCILEYFHHYEMGWDRWELLGADRFQGQLTTDLTGEIGATFFLRENPLAVNRTSWSGIKALYR